MQWKKTIVIVTKDAYRFGQHQEVLRAQKSYLYHQRAQETSYATEEYLQMLKSFATQQMLRTAVHVQAPLRKKIQF